MMVGEKVSLNIDRPEPENPREILKVSGLTCLDNEGVKSLDDVSFTAFGGEILGVAGICLLYTSGMIRFILGSVLKVESVLLLFPCIVAVFYRESAGYWFLLTAVLSFVIGYLMVRKKPANTVFYLKEGCVTTALSWIMISLVGCLPFYLSGEIPAFTGACCCKT